MSMIWNQHATERGHFRMRVGERIDVAVLHDAFTDARRELIAQRAFDEIAGQISDQRLRVVAGEKEMRQVVLARLRYAA
jgi:hypothetical protein